MKITCYILWATLLSCHIPAFANTQADAEMRAETIRSLIKKLDSDDLSTCHGAALELGQLKAKEAVPALLRVLQSSRFLTRSEHIGYGNTKGEASEWVLLDAKETIVTALGQIGDGRAIPVLKKYLRKSPKGSEMFPGNVAYALYLITGKAYKYKDRDGKLKVFKPSS